MRECSTYYPCVCSVSSVATGGHEDTVVVLRLADHCGNCRAAGMTWRDMSFHHCF